MFSEHLVNPHSCLDDHNGEVQTRNHEISTDPSSPKKVLRGFQNFYIEMYLRSRGRNFWSIFFKFGTNNPFCKRLSKFVGLMNGFGFGGFKE